MEVISVIAPTFFVIVLGLLLGRFGKSGSEALVDAALYVAVPCLVLSSLLQHEVAIELAAKMWAGSVLVMAGTYVLAKVVFWLLRQRHRGLYLPIVFANLMNIPFPIIYLAYGSEGLANAVLVYLPNALLIYSVGVYVASGQKGLRLGAREVARMPVIYAALLGLLLSLTGVRLPDLVMDSLGFMGQAGVPLLLLVLGMNLGGLRVSQVPLTLLAGALRMGGGFAFGLLAVWALGLTGVPRDIMLFQSAMPAAIVVAVICTKYKNDAELVSSVVFVTTVASIAVIPALLLYLG